MSSASIYVHPQNSECNAVVGTGPSPTLDLKVDGLTITIFGAEAHREALEKIAALFNGAFRGSQPFDDDADYLEPVSAVPGWVQCVANHPI
ncbi:hypothetical protein AX761_24340 [Rhizobium sp. 58]|nr:hypothetical protein AX761_24340 [Rhizobium sp. 58]